MPWYICYCSYAGSLLTSFIALLTIIIHADVRSFPSINRSWNNNKKEVALSNVWIFHIGRGTPEDERGWQEPRVSWRASRYQRPPTTRRTHGHPGAASVLTSDFRPRFPPFCSPCPHLRIYIYWSSLHPTCLKSPGSPASTVTFMKI